MSTPGGYISMILQTVEILNQSPSVTLLVNQLYPKYFVEITFLIDIDILLHNIYE